MGFFYIYENWGGEKHYLDRRNGHPITCGNERKIPSDVSRITQSLHFLCFFLDIFCFENTSVMKNKTLSYQIEVLEPDEESIEKAELGDNE